MYIPTQRSLTELSTSPLPSTSGTPAGSIGLDIKAAMPSRNDTSSSSTADDDPLHNSAAVIAVMAACLVFLIFLGVWAAYKRCFRRSRGESTSPSSDASSTFSASAWRAEDSHAASGAVAAKHRRRLRKLDQVAPSQSLAQWRRQKQTTHVQTFASVSNRLVCAICLDTMQEKELIRELRCGHVYHASCLDLWVERGHHDCPMCKCDILGLKKEDSKVLEVGHVDGGPEQSLEVQHSAAEEEPAVATVAVVVVDEPAPAAVARDEPPGPSLNTAQGANNERPRQE